MPVPVSAATRLPTVSTTSHVPKGTTRGSTETTSLEVGLPEAVVPLPVWQVTSKTPSMAPRAPVLLVAARGEAGRVESGGQAAARRVSWSGTGAGPASPQAARSTPAAIAPSQRDGRRWRVAVSGGAAWHRAGAAVHRPDRVTCHQPVQTGYDCSLGGWSVSMAADLHVERVWDLDLCEVLAICERPAGHGKTRQLLAVGDHTHHVLVGELRPDGLGPFQRHDLAPLLTDAGLRTPASAQWEGLDVDATGRVFVLREVPGTLLAFDAELTAMLHVFPLTIQDSLPEVEAWEDDDNSLGEGLLLRNGHLFVVKEEKPRQLLEFGLPGAQAEGLRDDLPVAHASEFSTPPSAAPPSSC
jgi:hypothetical protein